MARASFADFYKGVSNDALGAYLKRIAQVPLLKKEEELVLGKASQRGDEKALKKLVEANLRFVVKVALRYRGCGLSLPDLINEGNIGLLEAARRYSPDYNVKFITYAVWWIRQAIMQALAAGGGAVRLPLRKARLASRLDEVRADLSQQLQAAPTDSEVAEELDLSASDLEGALHRAGQLAFLSDEIGLEQRIGMELYDSKQLPAADHELIRRSFREEVERMLGGLASRERLIVELRFGLGEEDAMTLKEVGERLKLSRERVRQIEERAKQKLRVMAKSRHLKDYLN
ncbi:MAG: RNA polymerase sigma factor RpoD/SigA [bacterium]|uniref:RNA polymerase sigma factor RpoD/SigA n=1 Tax=Candidatus Methylomirabilis tolerans TaxID=3123416 RepID=A0AAJ1AHM8_9BACT|nr:RNA polymerase sigma factor RpoD/SigA [Candidatus Methylomirabilis sp.]